MFRDWVCPLRVNLARVKFYARCCTFLCMCVCVYWLFRCPRCGRLAHRSTFYIFLFLFLYLSETPNKNHELVSLCDLYRVTCTFCSRQFYFSSFFQNGLPSRLNETHREQPFIERAPSAISIGVHGVRIVVLQLQNIRYTRFSITLVGCEVRVRESHRFEQSLLLFVPSPFFSYERLARTPQHTGAPNSNPSIYALYNLTLTLSHVLSFLSLSLSLSFALSRFRSLVLIIPLSRE